MAVNMDLQSLSQIANGDSVGDGDGDGDGDDDGGGGGGGGGGGCEGSVKTQGQPSRPGDLQVGSPWVVLLPWQLSCWHCGSADGHVTGGCRVLDVEEVVVVFASGMITHGGYLKKSMGPLAVG